MKFSGWNINMRSQSGLIPSFVSDKTAGDDVAVFLEYKRNFAFESNLRTAGFVVKTSPQQAGLNEVLIAVKSEIKQLPLPSELAAQEAVLRETTDILSVPIVYEKKKILVLGTRVRIKAYDAETNVNEYVERGQQMAAIAEYVSSAKSFGFDALLYGDFNHGQSYSVTGPDFVDTFFDYSGLVSNPASLEKLQELFGKEAVLSPVGERTDVFSWTNGRARIKLDHLILSAGLKVTDLQYDWEFVTPENGYEGDRFAWKSQRGLPDHARLLATIGGTPQWSVKIKIPRLKGGRVHELAGIE